MEGVQVMLSDASVAEMVAHGVLGISGYTPKHQGPASYDLTIKGDLSLAPGEFRLWSTRERLRLPYDIQGQVHGRSSVGRMGVLVHFTAGFVDPGFEGEITLEMWLWPGATKTIHFKDGDRLAQIAFIELDKPAVNPYAGRYQGQVDPTPSRFQHGDD